MSEEHNFVSSIVDVANLMKNHTNNNLMCGARNN